MFQYQIYPYFVIRHFAGFYEKKACREDAVRSELIEEARIMAKRENKKTCIVFGPEDCVYFEPLGRYSISICPPSGSSLE